MFAAKNELLTRPSGYNISRSLRFRSSASAYLSRTPASATNQTTWTWSGWVKRGDLGRENYLFGATTDNYNVNWSVCSFNPSNNLYVQGYASSSQYNVVTTAVFRDPSAWYHIVISFDTTQATNTNRIKLYVNGILQNVSATYPSQNLNTFINRTCNHTIGGTSSSYTHDGYQAEVNFIDGQALTPSSFGAFDTNGVWQPAKYTGSYGTNGFYLNFSDNSGATATTIGKDSSGNSNNWTPNNISITAGTTYDSMIDSPTNYADGGNGRGNYATFNPLTPGYTGTLSNANLTAATVSSSYPACFATQAILVDTYYEMYVDALGTSGDLYFAVVGQRTTANWGTLDYSAYYQATTGTIAGGTGGAGNYATYTTGDLIGIAVSPSSQTVKFYKNNSLQTTLTGVSSLSTYNIPMVYLRPNNCQVSLNFGQRPFTYTPPSGFSALNTQNLPTPTITNGASYMAATTYMGNGTSQSITNSGAFQPDLVWVKGRSGATSHNISDVIRGTASTLFSNNTSAENTSGQRINAFNTTGFSVGNDADVNTNLATYVGWQWKKGVSQGFDIVSYAGDNTSNRNISHNLGVAPAFVWVKSLSTGSFYIYHQNLTGSTYFLKCNSTDGTNAQTNTNTPWGTGNWSSTQFMVTNNATNNLNASSTNYIGYLWAAIAGYSAFGSYTSNGLADGPFVYTGFRPRFVLIKNTDTAGRGWEILDTSRNTYNVSNSLLQPDSAAVESNSSNYQIDFVSNGFKIRGIDTWLNASSGTYIYAAFAENPFKISRAR